MMYALNVRRTAKGRVVAACDADVLGETFEDGAVRLEVSEGFYGGDEADIDEVVDAVAGCFTANLVGNELVPALVEAGVVAAGAVEEVDGVKHVQLFTV